MVVYRHEGQWRGTGLCYDPECWCLLRKIGCRKGSWYKIRNLHKNFELWLGTAHCTPGSTLETFEEELEDLFRRSPINANPVLLQMDANTAFRWQDGEDGVQPTAKEGKGHRLHSCATERGFSFLPPGVDQLRTPTTRPRQEGREGSIIDVLLAKGVRVQDWTVYENSYMCLGTDHELLGGFISFDKALRFFRHTTRPREWTGGPERLDQVNQAILEEMARTCTRPRPSQRYVDPPEVKQAFKHAKQRGTNDTWKAALRLRKQARQDWETMRVLAAAKGDWAAFKALKPKKTSGWDVEFASAQVDDPHDVVHRHLREVYSGPAPPAPSPHGLAQSICSRRANSRRRLAR